MRQRHFRNLSLKKTSAITYDPDQMSGEADFIRMKLGAADSDTWSTRAVAIADSGLNGEVPLVAGQLNLAEWGLDDLEVVGQIELALANNAPIQADVVLVNFAAECAQGEESHMVRDVPMAIIPGYIQPLIGQALIRLYRKADTEDGMVLIAPGPLFEQLDERQPDRRTDAWIPDAPQGQRIVVATATSPPKPKVSNGVQLPLQPPQARQPKPKSSPPQAATPKPPQPPGSIKPGPAGFAPPIKPLGPKPPK